MSPAKKQRGRLTAKFMAYGGFKFLLLTFQYLVGWGIINLVVSINYRRGSPARLPKRSDGQAKRNYSYGALPVRKLTVW
jgi:hypothetical protein